MPTIIDSLFLELGIDTSKFSKDQQRALAKISEFEKRSKKGAKGAAQSVKTVGEAFRDIADDSTIGGATKRLDSFSTKLKALGQASQVSGGLGTPLGKMAEGLGALLSPAALGAAALGLMGKAAWDFNSKMTATNATLERQVMLSGMGAKSLWAWGQAARTVGAQPGDISGAIAGLQTAVTGMGIGAGDATAQLVALARLGVGWNFKTGVNVEQLFGRVHQLAKKQGYRSLGALRALTAPVMNDAMFALATDPKFNPDKLQSEIKKLAPPNLDKIIMGSLESQKLLGKKDIRAAVLAEQGYGVLQDPMDKLVVLLTDLLGVGNAALRWTIKIAGWIEGIAEHFGVKVIRSLLGKSASPMVGGVPVPGKLPSSFQARQEMAMRALMGRGMSQNDAAAIVGNMSQESSLNPTATNDNGVHIGLMQLNRARQRDFAKAFGYQIGSAAVPLRRQFLDQLVFAQHELETTQKEAARRMAAARDLYGKTQAFQDYDERPGADDHSFGRRLLYAQAAFEMGMSYERMLTAANARRGVINRSVTNHTRIGDVHVHTPAEDPRGHVLAVRKGLSTQPLLDPVGQQQVALLNHGAR
ncbi:MAG TPA: phage tail tip lysozyme [Steroidobacteraceae bacterium]|nr:phage tail tip lysozyme [Steroidobacteraceae bacterium]